MTAWQDPNLGSPAQLADDLLDRVGEEAWAGKTLGTDGKREKPTAGSPSIADINPEKRIRELCASAEGLLESWPSVKEAFSFYRKNDLGPILYKAMGKSLAGSAREI